MKMSIDAYESAVGFLRDVLGQYDQVNLDLIRISDAWHNLDYNQRMSLGKNYPNLVDALLKIEARYVN